MVIYKGMAIGSSQTYPIQKHVIMKKKYSLGSLLLFASALFILFVSAIARPTPVMGLYTGITGMSGKDGTTCSSCHNTGMVPVVTLTGPTAVIPSLTYTYTLAIVGGQEKGGGFNVAIDQGALLSLEGESRLQNGEITHVAPKEVDEDKVVRFTFQWTAPITPTAVTMYGAGVSANLNNTRLGDAAAATTLQIAVFTPTDILYLPFINR
jgi:hypothetical protein